MGMGKLLGSCDCDYFGDGLGKIKGNEKISLVGGFLGGPAYLAYRINMARLCGYSAARNTQHNVY